MDWGNPMATFLIGGSIWVTSISFGSATKFVLSIVDIPHELVHDPVNNKVVILYRTSGDQTYYGKAIVGTISGTSISFYGSHSVFNPAYYGRLFSSSI